jgi:hypothetical protein
MAQSRLMMALLTQQIEVLIKNNASISKQMCICAFGSIARGEYDLHHSDVDLMFFQCTPRDRNTILSGLVNRNHCFPFEDLRSLLRSSTSKSKSRIELRFPVVNTKSLLGNDEQSRRRRIQFLFESQPLLNARLHFQLLTEVVTHYNLVPRHKFRQTPQRLITDLDAFYKTMKEDATQKLYPFSDYFCKYIMVRELGQHLVRLGLVQATLSRRRIRLTDQPAISFAHVLRQPALSKLFFWISQEFVGGRIMRALNERHHNLLAAKLRQATSAAGLETLAEDECLSANMLLGIIVDNAAKALSSTLDYLQSKEFRTNLQGQPANIVNWQTDANLRQVTIQVAITTRWLKALAEGLHSIFVFADSMGVMKKGYENSGLQVAVNYLRSGLCEESQPH